MNEPGRVNLRLPSPLAQHTYASEDDYRAAMELARIEQVVKRRQYYGGDQTDADNAACLRQLAEGQIRAGEKSLARYLHDNKLPEHLKLLAYSTQIEEAVDYLTHRLCAEFDVEAADETVQAILDACLDASPELSGTAEDDEISVVNVTREALLAQDCPVRVRFDLATGDCWLEFWASDAVRMDFLRERSDRPDYVAVRETNWVTDPAAEGGQRQVVIRREWKVQTYIYPSPDGAPRDGPVTVQCVESWWEERPGGDDLLLDEKPTGLPFVPWGLLRGRRRRLRTERGESVITNRAMALADRYDAVEQHSWLAARHNAHASLGVTGDAAMVSDNAKVLHKDIADVIVFPGGTDLHSVVLPTDPSMIEHQRGVILDALYGCFGLARVDQATLQGLGQVTGYALEILNTKTESTFVGLRVQFVRDWLALCNTVLDCHAHWTPATTAGADPESRFDPAAAVLRGLEVDPAAVYPNRAIEIRTGSGHVVDLARIREDYVAGLISLEEALRQQGYTDEEISQIRREQDDADQRRTERERINTTEAGTFQGAPPPAFGVVGGTTTPPTTGSVGGVVNTTRERRRRR